MKELFAKSETYSLRGVCMILIIIHHLFQASVSDYGYTWSTPVSVVLQSLGYLATSVFFLLSGYGLYMSINKNNPIGVPYIVSHLEKLVSPFLFVWLIDLVKYICEGGNDVFNIGISFLSFGLPGGAIYYGS